MIYISKEGLPDFVKSQIIGIQKSDWWKEISDDDTNAIRSVFDGKEFPKAEVKKILIHEQHGLCAYCMRRIRDDNHSRVEHFVPLSKDKEKAIDYENMLGVCDGSVQILGRAEQALCCDAHKAEQEIFINPLDKTQMDKIAYDKQGRIFTKPVDENMERDINEVLLLNGERKTNRDGFDPSTEFIRGRRDAYQRANHMLDRLGSKCSAATVKRMIERIEREEIQDEYVGVILFRLNKKYKSLVNQRR